MELEALAVLESVEHFCFYLSRRRFTIVTDHSALVDIWQGPPLSANMARWIERLSDFNFTIIYIKGEVNSVYDAMSRQSWPTPAAISASDVSLPTESSASKRGGDVVNPPHQRDMS